jgi:hypothetical protein
MLICLSAYLLICLSAYLLICLSAYLLIWLFGARRKSIPAQDQTSADLPPIACPADQE